MNTREDKRVLRTKETLISTFRDMLATKRFEDITVNDLCAESGIRRATFYKHFSDKYDFLRFFVGALRHEFDKVIWKKKKPDATAEYYVAYARQIIEFVTRNSTMVKLVLESEISPTILEIIMEQNYSDTCDRLRKSVDEGMILPTTIETMSAMLTGAVTRAIFMWFKNGMPTPKEKFIEEVSAGVAAMQKNAISS